MGRNGELWGEEVLVRMRFIVKTFSRLKYRVERTDCEKVLNIFSVTYLSHCIVTFILDRWKHWWIIVIALFVLMAAYLVNVFFH